MTGYKVFNTADPATVWIQSPDGEGGTFPAMEVAAAMTDGMLDKYFWEKF